MSLLPDFPDGVLDGERNEWRARIKKEIRRRVSAMPAKMTSKQLSTMTPDMRKTSSRQNNC